jgi:hypothetical protein
MIRGSWFLRLRSKDPKYSFSNENSSELAKTGDEELDTFDGTLSKRRFLWPCKGSHYQNAMPFVVADPQQLPGIGADRFQRVSRSRNK